MHARHARYDRAVRSSYDDALVFADDEAQPLQVDHQGFLPDEDGGWVAVGDLMEHARWIALHYLLLRGVKRSGTYQRISRDQQNPQVSERDRQSGNQRVLVCLLGHAKCQCQTVRKLLVSTQQHSIQSYRNIAQVAHAVYPEPLAMVAGWISTAGVTSNQSCGHSMV